MLLKVEYMTHAIVKDAHGNKTPHPIDEGKHLTEEKRLKEAIDVFRIKAIRPFHGNRYKTVSGAKMICVYLKPDTFKDKARELHVVADYDGFVETVNGLKSRAREEEETA